MNAQRGAGGCIITAPSMRFWGGKSATIRLENGRVRLDYVG